MENYNRGIFAFKDYFLEFYEEQTKEVQEKIEWTLNLIRVMRQVPEKYFKHIEGVRGLYEIRVESGSRIIRIFAFFDKGNLIILGNAFQKQSQKTPKKEIQKAIKIMNDYFYENKN